MGTFTRPVTSKSRQMRVGSQNQIVITTSDNLMLSNDLSDNGINSRKQENLRNKTVKTIKRTNMAAT